MLPLIGGLFAALDHAVMSTSVEFTRIANATLLNNMAPLWVAIFAILVWKEKMKWGFWVGLLLAFAGAATVLGSNILGDPGLSKGNIMALVSSIFYAGYFLITQVARTRLTTITYIWLVDLFAAGFLMLINLGLGNSFGPYPASTDIFRSGTRWGIFQPRWFPPPFSFSLLSPQCLPSRSSARRLIQARSWAGWLPWGEFTS